MHAPDNIVAHEKITDLAMVQQLIDGGWVGVANAHGGRYYIGSVPSINNLSFLFLQALEHFTLDAGNWRLLLGDNLVYN